MVFITGHKSYGICKNIFSCVVRKKSFFILLPVKKSLWRTDNRACNLKHGPSLRNAGTSLCELEISIFFLRKGICIYSRQVQFHYPMRNNWSGLGFSYGHPCCTMTTSLYKKYGLAKYGSVHVSVPVFVRIPVCVFVYVVSLWKINKFRKLSHL
jgi:hypothetical protein